MCQIPLGYVVSSVRSTRVPALEVSPLSVSERICCQSPFDISAVGLFTSRLRAFSVFAAAASEAPVGTPASGSAAMRSGTMVPAIASKPPEFWIARSNWRLDSAMISDRDT